MNQSGGAGARIRALKAANSEKKSAVDAGKSEAGTSSKPIEVVRLEEDISAYLGAPFTIEDAGDGTGRLVIEYGSSDIRDGLLEKIYPGLYPSEDEF